MTANAILWNRLDASGHDACHLVRLDDGWRLEGHAVFNHAGAPCSLAYTAECGGDWRTRAASATGWLGARGITVYIQSENAAWVLNGAEQPQVSGCIDIDLGFTPATNLIAIRRFSLRVGEETPAPAAYLSFPELELDVLEQSYRRLDETRYAYSAPAFGYAATLEVSEAGFVTDYPGLWKAV